MEHVDPPTHGTVTGEPYFLIYVEGELVERSKRVIQDDDRNFTLAVRPGGLQQFEEGDLDVTVKLMDIDSVSDDVYGVQNLTVPYSPD